MSATLTWPASAAPGNRTRPRFCSPKVTVASASTQGPSGRPVSAESPDGTSTESTRAPPRRAPAMASMAAAKLPSAGRDSPVPRSASITTSSPLAPSGCPSAKGATGTPASRARRAITAASPPSSSGATTANTRTRPEGWSSLAATQPSPPLLPPPQTTTKRLAGRTSGATASATARPARSIRSSEGTPSPSMAARSMARISSAPTSLTAPPAPRSPPPRPRRASW